MTEWMPLYNAFFIWWGQLSFAIILTAVIFIPFITYMKKLGRLDHKKRVRKIVNETRARKRKKGLL